MVSLTAETIMAGLMRMAEQRGTEKSFCPSEMAREEGGDWRALMPGVRAAALCLRDQGKLDILARGERIAGSLPKGPIRLRLRSRSAGP